MDDKGHRHSISGGCKDINIVVLGAKGVGKSAMIVRFLTGRYIGDYDSAMEAVVSAHLQLEGKQVAISVLDTASYVQGQEVRSQSVTWADGFMLVFSLTDETSFWVVQELIVKLRRARGDERIPIFVAGNKSDLVHLRAVNLLDIETWVGEQGCLFCEVSASEEPLSVKNAFYTLCKQIRAVNKKREKLSWMLQRPAVAAKLQIRQSLKNLTDRKMWRSRTSTF